MPSLSPLPKLRDVATIREKIASGKPVSIGVFCSGNGDRSPLIQQVLQTEFNRRGLNHVRVFSFGLSTSPTSHHKGAAARTAEYANELGYPGIKDHQRRHIGDADVGADIKGADLMFAVSPSHLAFAAEYGADEYPKAARDIVRKTWTLKGFAQRKQWMIPFDGIARAFGTLARGLATKDPYFEPKNDQGNAAFRRKLDDAINDAKKAAKRLAD